MFWERVHAQDASTKALALKEAVVFYVIFIATHSIALLF